ncbi:uncharacterized protein LOC113203194 [Frankliniella occidentalis]|uniref:Uncharacterized protein LOC113203194 n=1 Tax=Frankliniella occidentalis TaxID=133901 RepID=A0A6J1RX52_FRAOC|nr:uncharacterized protein LOC113203194 [Frankliniella occidentalis]
MAVVEGLRTFAILSDFSVGRSGMKGTNLPRTKALCDVKNTLQVRQLGNVPIKRLVSTTNSIPCSKSVAACSVSPCLNLEDSCSEWEHCNCSQHYDYSADIVRLNTECLGEDDIVYVTRGIFNLQHTENETNSLPPFELDCIDAADNDSYLPTEFDYYFLPIDDSLDQPTYFDPEDC